MKQRTPRRWLLLVALGAHVFVPFAAYASATSGTALRDVCPVFGKVKSPAGAPVGLPAQRSDHHAADHCAFCPGGAATAAVLPPALPTMMAHAHEVVPRRVDGAAPATVLLLLPPSRAPPIAS